MNKTLFRYIFKMQLEAMLFVSFFIFCLIFLFDFAEITRKFPISNMKETFFAIKLSFFRTPNTFCEILHYIYFITSTFTLWSLCRSHQITVLKSSGISPQQILYPFVSCAFFISVLWLFILHPLGQFSEKLYDKNIDPNTNVEVNHDIWIDCIKDNKMIFIKSISGNDIEELCMFDLNNKNSENLRIFAEKAKIAKNSFELIKVTVVRNNTIKNVEKMIIYTNISDNLIKILSIIPKKHDIYSLYKIYKIQDRDVVALRLYELELHKLLANCANFMLFALIAAVICFPINRYKTKTSIAVEMIGIAIVLRFANNIFESLACKNILPVTLASWIVVLVLSCLSISILIWKEV